MTESFRLVSPPTVRMGENVWAWIYSWITGGNGSKLGPSESTINQFPKHTVKRSWGILGAQSSSILGAQYLVRTERRRHHAAAALPVTKTIMLISLVNLMPSLSPIRPTAAQRSTSSGSEVDLLITGCLPRSPQDLEGHNFQRTQLK